MYGLLTFAANVIFCIKFISTGVQDMVSPQRLRRLLIATLLLASSASADSLVEQWKQGSQLIPDQRSALIAP